MIDFNIMYNENNSISEILYKNKMKIFLYMHEQMTYGTKLTPDCLISIK